MDKENISLSYCVNINESSICEETYIEFYYVFILNLLFLIISAAKATKCEWENNEYKLFSLPGRRWGKAIGKICFIES